MTENKINWEKRLSQFGEITGFMATGFLIAQRFYWLSIIIFAVSIVLADVAANAIIEEAKNEV